MKALLVYPSCPETFWSFSSALKIIAKKSSEPPLGLLTVAALFPTDWNLKVVDMKVQALSDRNLLWADLVFISAMSIQRQSVNNLIERCRKLGVKTVAGGPLFTSCPDDFPGVDHLVLGEAEVTLKLFLDDLAQGIARHRYDPDQVPDIRNSPIPRYDLIDINQYATMDIQYSRGCPFNCEFCDITSLFGRKVRTKSTGQILAELQNIYNLGWRGGVFFVDDNFIGNKVRLKQDVLPALIEFMKARNYPFSLSTEASIDLADDHNLMQMMTKAGFTSIFIGIETPNQKSLNECDKKQNVGRNLLESIQRIQATGLEVKGGFIVGFDNDTPSIFEQMSNFIRDSGIVTAMVGLLNAPRGTRLYQRLVKEGRLINEATGDNTDCTLNFIPKMNQAVLIQGYQQILRNIYSLDTYYQRVREFLIRFETKGLPRRPGRLRQSDIIGFFRSIYTIGFREPGRRHYWRLVFETLFRRPRLFSLAMTYAVYGHHFRKIYGTHL